MEIGKGSPCPLGASKNGSAINFALFSEHATEVRLCLFEPAAVTPFREISLDPKTNRTGWIWHISISDLPDFFDYAYRCDGPNTAGLLFNPKHLLSDPYAKILSDTSAWAETDLEGKPLLSRIIPQKLFEWENDAPPQIPLQDLIIYEMHVRGLTKHPSSKVKNAGSFLGVIEKIPYLKQLGINAVELLPIHYFNENEYKGINPITHDRLKNYWGYSTINFFAPMHCYASSLQDNAAIDEFKTMVKALHKNNIEVILDIVFNHTAEGGLIGPYYSFKGIDNSIYYILDSDGNYKDFTGCGNTVNANHPVVIEFILDVLRYWVVEMHVDGFRFDLASALTRGLNGEPLINPPLIQAIAKDPVLGNTIKLIAEPWDAVGLYNVGSFPEGDSWAEWNGKYRDHVRRFIKGTDGEAGNFANALCGSEHLFVQSKSPYHSINFVTAHDGFTLFDLVSYQDKHNEMNGEENRDGSSVNDSWNCGAEGPTQCHKTLVLRERQRRNFHVALMLSIGTPMLLMGDEYGHTKLGNNNTWCQDNQLNWFLWDQVDKDADFFRFFTTMIDFRKKHPILRRETYLTPDDVQWHGRTPFQPDWNAANRFVAYTLKDPTYHHDLYIAFNAHFEDVHFQLPAPPAQMNWHRIVDTSLPSPQDFMEEPAPLPSPGITYTLPAYSSLLLKAR
jgi:isoamylase/glycogen operon protein